MRLITSPIFYNTYTYITLIHTLTRYITFILLYRSFLFVWFHIVEHLLIYFKFFVVNKFFTHTHTHTYIRTHTNAHIHTYTHKYTHIHNIYISIYIYIQVFDIIHVFVIYIIKISYLQKFIINEIYKILIKLYYDNN